MKTVIILGAGVSRAAGGNKSVAKRPPLDGDFFLIAKAGQKKRYRQVSQILDDLVGDYANTLRSSLEASAAYLYLKALDSHTGSVYHKGFLKLLQLLNLVLARTTNDLPLGPRSLLYRFLLSEVRKVGNPQDLTVITFNYDLLAERSLYEIASRNGRNLFSFPGCYRLEDIEKIQRVQGCDPFADIEKDHDGVSVLKLHGSMNWQSRHTSGEPTPSALFSPRRAIHVLNSPEIPGSLTWKPNKRRIYMKPIIVPPVSGKRGMMHSALPKLWNVAARSLKEADRVVVAGYSCPPLDLEARILLSENLRANSAKKLYVIDPDAVSAAKFIEICGVDHATIYRSVKEWVRDSTT